MSVIASIISVRAYFKHDLYSLRLELSEKIIPTFCYNEIGNLEETTTNIIYMPALVSGEKFSDNVLIIKHQ